MLEDDLLLTQKGWLRHFMGGWDPAIQMPRYAKLYFGLNVDLDQEGVTLKGILKIPIPFMKQDHGIIRFRKIKFPDTYDGYKIRCDQEIERLEQKLVGENRDSPLDQVGRMIIDELKYIQSGPYDPNR